MNPLLRCVYARVHYVTRKVRDGRKRGGIGSEEEDEGEMVVVAATVTRHVSPSPNYPCRWVTKDECLRRGNSPERYRVWRIGDATRHFFELSSPPPPPQFGITYVIKRERSGSLFNRSINLSVFHDTHVKNIRRRFCRLPACRNSRDCKEITRSARFLAISARETPKKRREKFTVKRPSKQRYLAYVQRKRTRVYAT